MANIIVRSTNEEDALSRSAALGRLLNPAPEGVRVMGPAPAPVLRVKTEYRYQMLLKTSGRKRLSEVLGEVRRFAAAEKWGPANLAIDVDPMTLALTHARFSDCRRQPASRHAILRRRNRSRRDSPAGRRAGHLFRPRLRRVQHRLAGRATRPKGSTDSPNVWPNAPATSRRAPCAGRFGCARTRSTPPPAAARALC